MGFILWLIQTVVAQLYVKLIGLSLSFFFINTQCFSVCARVRVKQVEEALEGVKNATNEQDLANRFKEFGKEMVKLNYVAARRQQVTERSFQPLCISSEGNKKKDLIDHLLSYLS